MIAEGPDTPEPHPPEMQAQCRLTAERIEAALRRGELRADALLVDLRSVTDLDANTAGLRLR